MLLVSKIINEYTMVKNVSPNKCNSEVKFDGNSKDDFEKEPVLRPNDTEAQRSRDLSSKVADNTMEIQSSEPGTLGVCDSCRDDKMEIINDSTASNELLPNSRSCNDYLESQSPYLMRADIGRCGL